MLIYSAHDMSSQNETQNEEEIAESQLAVQNDK